MGAARAQLDCHMLLDDKTWDLPLAWEIPGMLGFIETPHQKDLRGRILNAYGNDPERFEALMAEYEGEEPFGEREGHLVMLGFIAQATDRGTKMEEAVQAIIRAEYDLGDAFKGLGVRLDKLFGGKSSGDFIACKAKHGLAEGIYPLVNDGAGYGLACIRYLEPNDPSRGMVELRCWLDIDPIVHFHTVEDTDIITIPVHEVAQRSGRLFDYLFEVTKEWLLEIFAYEANHSTARFFRLGISGSYDTYRREQVFNCKLEGMLPGADLGDGDDDSCHIDIQPGDDIQRYLA